MFQTIALDADDTLWHNETYFFQAHEQFRRLLRPFHPDEWIDQRLLATERRNLARYGYGIKAFTLSMIETALELSEGRMSGAGIQQILDLGKARLAQPVEPLPHVQETLETLAKSYALMVITKGDLFDQESKLARSGLGDGIRHFEVVSEKSEASYRAVLARHGIAPRDFLMVGNSVRSDILPVLALGGQAVYVPYALTWEHERVEASLTPEFPVLEHLGQLPAWLEAQDGLTAAAGAR